MADNTILNTGTGGDTARTIDRAGVKTQVAQIDVGGASGESLLVRGQQSAANSVPVVDANSQTPLTTTPDASAPAQPTRVVGMDQWVCSFAGSGASVLSADMATPIVGTGVTYNQTSGSLNILTGTTTNAEFLTRSLASFKGSMRLRASVIASQRITNQNLQITLADLIGEGLAYTIVSATVVNVTKTAHGFTSQNVGQFMNLAGITGAAGVPGRYAIASIVDANTIQFTVAGWPATGTGTLTLFGWNYSRNLINGVTATALAWDCQRRGWANGDTTATINTTATPGTIIENHLTGRDAFLQDALRATATSPTFTTRASRYDNMPDKDVALYIWVWSYNGTVAPATTTTWTIGFLALETLPNLGVYVQGVRSAGTSNPLPISGPVTASIAAAQTLATVTTVGTVSTITTLPSLVAGTAAVGDVGLQVRANATGAATISKFAAAATTNAASIKATAGRVLGWSLYNTTAAVKFFRFFNLAVAPTMGTSSPVLVVAVPPNGSAIANIPQGIAFATGIAIACTGGVADLDATATAANDVVGGFFYA